MSSNDAVLSSVLTNLFNTIPFPIFCKDQNHKFVALNDIECEYLGYSRQEMLGKSDLDFFPQKECDVFWAVDDEVLQSGQIISNDEVVTDAFGIVRRLCTKKGRIYTPEENHCYSGFHLCWMMRPYP